MQTEHPDESEQQLWQRMWKTQFDRPVTQPGKRSEWLINPNSNSRYVAVQPLTGINEDSIVQASMILQSTSLNGVANKIYSGQDILSFSIHIEYSTTLPKHLSDLDFNIH